MNEYICTKKVYQKHYINAWFKSQDFKLSLVIGALFIMAGICFCLEKHDVENYLVNLIWIFGGLYIAFARGFVRASSAYKYQAKVHLMENWRNRAIFEEDKIMFQSEVRGKEENDWMSMPILYKDIKSIIVKGNAITITVKVGLIIHLYKDCFSKMTYEDFCKIIREKCECTIDKK